MQAQRQSQKTHVVNSTVFSHYTGDTHVSVTDNQTGNKRLFRISSTDAQQFGVPTVSQTLSTIPSHWIEVPPTGGAIRTNLQKPATEPLTKSPDTQVKVVDLFISKSIEKEYGGYTMTLDSDGKFKRWDAKSKAWVEPSHDAIRRFLNDIAQAAKSDKDVAAFVESNLTLKRR